MDVMIDLETMGVGPTAAIISIGAVIFDLNTRLLGGEFYVAVDLASSVAAGGVMDVATVLWWMQQSDEARAVLADGGKDIVGALRDLSAWIGFNLLAVPPGDPCIIWCCGASFDHVILGSAYRACHLKQPWEFRYERDYRTVKALHRHVPMQRSGTHHNALDDAVNQAQHLIDMLAPN